MSPIHAPTKRKFTNKERSTPKGRQSSESSQATEITITAKGKAFTTALSLLLRSTSTCAANKVSRETPAQRLPNTNAAIPATTMSERIAMRVHRLRTSTLKISWMKVGRRKSATSTAAKSANDLVKASGRNNLPSAASMVKTGMKLMMVVLTAVRMAEPTSAEAL